jgi:hypothetical protein
MTDENQDSGGAANYGFTRNVEVTKRSLRLCHDVLRNYAYYRATRRLIAVVPSDYARTVNGNFLEMVVLDWCKLFADIAGEHHWRRSFSQKKSVRAALARAARQTKEDFNIYTQSILFDRNKFVAHLDSPPDASPLTRNIPNLKICRRTTVLLGGALFDALGYTSENAGRAAMRRYYIAKYREGFTLALQAPRF